MNKKYLSLAGGTVAGILAVTIGTVISRSIYPPPPDLGPLNTAVLEMYLATMPDGLFVATFLQMAAAGTAIGFTASRIDRVSGARNGLMVALLFTMFGVAGMLAVAHPVKLWVINLVTYLPFAMIGSRIATKGNRR